MSPILFHLYGPFAIHSFGVMIMIGLLLALFLLHRDQQLKEFITDEQLATIFQISFFGGIIGGRIWFLITNASMIEHWTECFTVWSGGLSISGALIGIITALSCYFYYKQLPALPILDRLALYGILAQSIARWGCFFAGCCYGKATTLPWSIIYTHCDSLAPLHVHMHPTQLYSSLFLACSFIILYLFDHYYTDKKAGQILALYIMLSSLDRFLIDFLRGDRELFVSTGFMKYFSTQQALAFCLFTGAFIMMNILFFYKRTDESI